MSDEYEYHAKTLGHIKMIQPFLFFRHTCSLSPDPFFPENKREKPVYHFYNHRRQCEYRDHDNRDKYIMSGMSVEGVELLQMVTTPYFTRESVEKERGIIAEEIKMYADNADAQVYERLFAVMFPDHPARIPIAGSVESIQSITAQTLLDCYDAFYKPCNMILCVAGKLPPERVFALAREYTPKEAAPCVVRKTTAQTNAPLTRMTRREMDVAMPIFTVCVRLPDLERGDVKTEIACELAAELTAGEASRCYQRLYEAGLIDAGFYAGFESLRELAMFAFGGDSESPEAVRDAVLEEAQRILREGVDAEELARLKRSLLGRRLRELDSFGGTCNRICGYFFDGVDYLRFREAFDAVTADDVLQILTHVTSENACMSVILPRA